jgi:hypothetical protein
MGSLELFSQAGLELRSSDLSLPSARITGVWKETALESFHHLKSLLTARIAATNCHQQILGTYANIFIG